jgi:hypothetical protein
MRRVEEHLRGCEEHRAAAGELRRTSALLPLVVEEAEPSPTLRQRVIDAVKAHPSMATTVSPPPSTAVALPPEPRPRRLSENASRLAIAAGLVLALGVAGVVGYQLGHANQAQVAYSFRGDPSAAPGAQAHLIYFKDRKQAVIVASGLPRLTAGHVYEMWLINNGVPVDKGIGSAPTGELAAQLSGDVTQFQQFAITIEPGEQSQPTTKPILVGNLQGGSA